MKLLKWMVVILSLMTFAFSAMGLHVDKRSSQVSISSHKKPNGHLMGYSTPWDWAEQDPTAFANALANQGLNYTLIEVDFKKDAACLYRLLGETF